MTLRVPLERTLSGLATAGNWVSGYLPGAWRRTAAVAEEAIAEKNDGKEVRPIRLYVNGPFSKDMTLLRAAFEKERLYPKLYENKIMEFAQIYVIESLKNINAMPPGEQKEAAIATVKECLAKLLYLGEWNLYELYPQIDCADIKKSVDYINAAFRDAIIAVKKEVVQHLDERYREGFFDYQAVERIETARGLAKMLMTVDGLLNVNLIPVLCREFLVSKVAFVANLKTILGAIHAACDDDNFGVSFLKHFYDVKAPLEGRVEAWDVIKATLQTEPYEIIKTIHARKAVLIALLSIPNAAPAPLSLSKHLLAVRLDKTLCEMARLLYYEKLTYVGEENEVKDLPWDFDFVFDHFTEQITVGREGQFSTPGKETVITKISQLIYSRLHIWELPSLVAACKQFGVEVEEYWKDDTNFSQDEQQFTGSLMHLIGRFQPKDEKLGKRGCLYFLGRHQCPLLLAWQDVVNDARITCAEGGRRARMMSAVQEAFANFRQNHEKLVSPSVFNELERLFFEKLLERVTFFRGIESIFEQEGNEIKSSIDSLVTFRLLILKAIDSANEVLSTKKISQRHKGEYQSIVDLFKAYVNRDNRFFHELVVAYDPRNKVPGPSLDFSNVPHNSPWKDKDRYDQTVAAEVYDNFFSFKHVPLQRIRNGEGFLLYWINRAAKVGYSHPIHSSLQSYVDARREMGEDLKVVKSQLRQLFESRMKVSGREVATRKLDKKAQSKIAKFVREMLCTSACSEDLFQALLELHMDDRSLFLYSNRLLKEVLIVAEREKWEPEQLACRLRNFIMRRVLSPEDHKKITDNAVVLFESPWVGAKGRKFNFVAYYDPLLADIAIGLMSEDGERLRALSRRDWLEHEALVALTSRH